MVDRNGGFRSQQHRDRIRRQLRQAGAVDFFNILTGSELLDMTDAYLPEHRERLYPPTVTLSMFMKQGLEADRSCQRAVNAWAAQRAADGLSVQSIRTGAYCQARQRLPLEMVTALTRETGRLLSTQAQRGWRWRGRAVKLADGTGISMPDTSENQARYPQPSSQAEGVGFPLARLVGIVCLSTGAVLEAAIGPHAGQRQSELDLFRSLVGALSAGDVLLADALYCNYFLIVTLQSAGVDVLFEQHGARNTDFRRGQALGQRDHLVRWSKPKMRPAWMTPQQYRAFPEELTVREMKVEGRVLVTTMLDARQVRKSELSELYARRWHVELDIRNIKTTLGMEVLRCLTPPMVEKELWVYLLAYNVIRLLMAQAARDAGMHPRELSFKHTVQMWTEWTSQTLPAHPAHQAEFFRLIAQLTVGNRPGRIEPRARKRRPKSYPWLKVPRAEARRQIRTYGHLLCA
ncbi:MAG: IS4 family transposase [Chloroflexi bacterium]|nr:MAG: IS4 family transposase [Chloroflexota bacterium]